MNQRLEITPTGRAPAEAPRRPRRIWLALGLLLVTVNLRIGVASVGPVLADIQYDLGLGDVAAGLLTTIPVAAFGAFAFLAPPLGRRLGLHRCMVLAMATLAAGIVLRLHPSRPALFVGTVIIGASIAVGNVVMPAAIKGDFPDRIGLMMGLYATVLSGGAALASGIAVPLVEATGGWRVALALGAVPAVVALLWMLPQLPGLAARAVPSGGVGPAGGPVGGESLRVLMRDPIARAVTAFMGLQSMVYYSTLAWIPTLFRDAGFDDDRAGWMLSYSAVPAIVASLLAPTIARRCRRTWAPVVVATIVAAVGLAGLALDPTWGSYVWMTALGVGQGTFISLALTYIVWRTADVRQAGQLSMAAQGFGYLVAGLGPIGLGALRSLSGGWSLPLVVLIVVLAGQLRVGVIASRDGQVLVGPPGASAR